MTKQTIAAIFFLLWSWTLVVATYHMTTDIDEKRLAQLVDPETLQVVSRKAAIVNLVNEIYLNK